MDLPRGLKLIHTERLIACLLHLSVTYCAAVGYRYCVHRTARILDSAASPSLYEISRNMNHALRTTGRWRDTDVLRCSWQLVVGSAFLQSVNRHFSAEYQNPFTSSVGELRIYFEIVSNRLLQSCFCITARPTYKVIISKSVIFHLRVFRYACYTIQFAN